MDVEILELVFGAKKARGLTVIIDVLRACSLECYVMANGASKIIACGSVSEALDIKAKFPKYLIMGEKDYHVPKGFDYGNSPSQIKDVDFSGKTVIHSTSSGTPGIIAASGGADEIITCSFVNVGAVASYIRSKRPDVVSIVAMGVAGKSRAVEDLLCAEYLRDLLKGNDVDFGSVYNLIKDSDSGKKFLESKSNLIPRADFDLCIKLDVFDFVLRARRGDEGLLFLERV